MSDSPNYLDDRGDRFCDGEMKGCPRVRSAQHRFHGMPSAQSFTGQVLGCRAALPRAHEHRRRAPHLR